MWIQKYIHIFAKMEWYVLFKNSVHRNQMDWVAYAMIMELSFRL